MILFHDLHQFHQDLGNVDILHLHLAVLGHKHAQIVIQTCPVRLAPELADCHNSILDLTDITGGDALDRLLEQGPVMLAHPSHHTHIDPDDLAVPDPQIAGMGIRMEKAVIQNLMNIIVDKFRTDLIQIITVFQELFLVIDLNAIDIFHDKNTPCRITSV